MLRKQERKEAHTRRKIVLKWERGNWMNQFSRFFDLDFQPPKDFGVFIGAPKIEPQLFLEKPQMFLMSRSLVLVAHQGIEPWIPP